MEGVKTKINIMVLMILIIFSTIFTGCVEDEKKDEGSGIKGIDIFYQIEVDYTGKGPYSIQVPVFIDQDYRVLDLNGKFKTKSGEAKLSINYTDHGPSLLLESSGSFCIEINESFQDKSEFTNNTAGLSLFEVVGEEYWIHSTVQDENLIKLTLTDIRTIYDIDGTIKMDSKLVYEGNIKFGWNVIKGELTEVP